MAPLSVLCRSWLAPRLGFPSSVGRWCRSLAHGTFRISHPRKSVEWRTWVVVNRHRQWRCWYLRWLLWPATRRSVWSPGPNLGWKASNRHTCPVPFPFPWSRCAEFLEGCYRERRPQSPPTLLNTSTLQCGKRTNLSNNYTYGTRSLNCSARLKRFRNCRIDLSRGVHEHRYATSASVTLDLR